MLDGKSDRDKGYLENMVEWEERRRAVEKRLSEITGRSASQLIMNREGGWARRRREMLQQRDLTEGMERPGPYVMDVIATRCLNVSLSRLNQLRQEYKETLKKPDKEPYIPEYDKLIVTGESVQAKKTEREMFVIPKIVVDTVPTQENPPHYFSERAVLEIGPCTLKEGIRHPMTVQVEMSPIGVNQTQARDVTFSNKGPKAIVYSWTRYYEKETNLPLKYTKNLLGRFFFDRCGGILLPGQTFDHRFMFRSKTPGMFHEVWKLKTSPMMSSVTFKLSGLACSDPKSEEHFNEIEAYLERCISRSIALEAAESILKMTAAPDPAENSGSFLEKEIFMKVNPLLHYDMDCIREAKQLHDKYCSQKWNYSMTDLLESLLKHTKKDKTERENVTEAYVHLLQRMQKKPLTEELSEKDWEHFKVDLCYLVMCSGVGEMEASLRHYSWNLPPPPMPPGTKEDYAGEMFEAEIHPEEPEEGACWTDDEERRLEQEEEWQTTSGEGLKEYTIKLDDRIDLDGKDNLPLPERRWPLPKREDQVDINPKVKKPVASRTVMKAYSAVSKGRTDHQIHITEEHREKPSSLLWREVQSKYEAQEGEEVEEEGEEMEEEEDLSVLPSPQLHKFYSAFQLLQWREILGRTVDIMVTIMEEIKIYKGEKDIVVKSWKRKELKGKPS